MKRSWWLSLSIMLMVVSVGLTSAQGASVVLQVAVTEFAQDSVQIAIDAYEAQNPDVSVQIVDVDGFGVPVNPNDEPEEFHEDLAAYFQTADVLLVDSSLNSEATRAGYVLDLSPLTQGDPNYNESAYHFSMVNAFRWDFGQWALPISANFVTIAYLPDAFDEAGLNYPDGSWTLDDLIFATELLNEYNPDGSIAIPGLNILGDVEIDYLLRSLYGQSLADLNAFPTIPNYGDPALATLLDDWQAFADEIYTTFPGDDIEFDDIPMLIINPQFVGGAFAASETIFSASLLPGNAAGMDVLGYAVSSGTNFPQQAYNLALYLTQDTNSISVAGGSTPALINPPAAAEGFISGLLTPNETLTSVVNDALASNISQNDALFAGGLSDALDIMARDGVSGGEALATVSDEQAARLTFADERAQTTVITVNPPRAETVLAPGEVEFTFGVREFGGTLSGTFETLAEEFVAQDPEVASINVDEQIPFLTDFDESTQCYYSTTNDVANIDLSTILSIDPLLFSDPNFNQNDYINGILQQVQVNGLTYAMPVTMTPLVLSVRPAAFEQAGVPVPFGTWTVSEFEDALRQLATVAAPDTAPFTVTGSTPLVMLMAIYGGQPFDISTGEVILNFTDPAVVSALQQVLTLAEDGLIEYDAGGFGFGGGGDNSSPIINQLLFNGGFGGGDIADRVILPFPEGLTGNAVAVDIGTMYISSTAQNPEACYRFMSYVAQNADVFGTMPVTFSLLSSSRLQQTQDQATLDFYNTTAQMISDPNTLLLPTNLDLLELGMTQWLTGVFEGYLDGSVIDLAAELAVAQQSTLDYIACIDGLEFDLENFQEFQENILACIDAAST